MTRGVRIRLAAFVVLSAVGIMYVTANYLGLVDKITGRDITVTASLPGSGGLFEGSEVTYRGVKIGKVARMDATEEGVDLTLSLQPGTELPTDSALFVHNLSAVGEQYLDFEPPDDEPPYAVDGTAFHGDKDSLPTDEGDLLVSIDDFVESVDKDNLRSVVKELGLMFSDSGGDLQTLLDNGSKFIHVASQHTDETIALLDNGLKVLRTQRGQSENIRAFADDLNTLTTALRKSDAPLRTVLDETPGAAREVQALLEDLEPTLPVLLSDMVTTGQAIVVNLNGLEQLLVTYPTLMAGGPSGSTRDGWGHVNVQMDYSVPPCTDGYLPRSQWRDPLTTTDAPVYPAHCDSGPPYEMRGPEHTPPQQGTPNSSPARVYSGGYNPVTGEIPGIVDARGNAVEYRTPDNLSVLGGDSWKWLLVGPVAGR